MALACERFSGSHTFDRIAEKLHNIFGKFELNVSINVATITDNGNNFVKSFKEFGVKLKEIEPSDISEEIQEETHANVDDEEDEEETNV